MARPREFDREEALERATGVFWAKGYASTSTDDLLTAMGIGRQSLYNAFQDKRALYLEALERYQRTTTTGHLQRLNGAATAVRSSYPGSSVYAMTKAAVAVMVKGIAVDLAPRGITVNNIQPGPTLT